MSRSKSAQLLPQAMAHHHAGRLDEAERLYRQVLAADARDADALHLLGVVAHQRRREDEALDLITRAIALRPSEAKYHNNLGEVLRATHRPAEAAEAYARAIALKPQYAEALNNRALALRALGRTDDAIDDALRAIQVRRDYAKAWNNLGVLLADKPGTYAEAKTAYETALRHKPDYAEAHNNLGSLLSDHGNLGPAEEHFRAAIRASTTYVNPFNGLGVVLSRQGRLEESIAAFRQGLVLLPDAVHHSNLLLCLHYAAGISPSELLEEHRAWARLYATPTELPPAHANDRDPDRRLRVGYVSPDFREHPVSFFFEPIVQAHDRAQVEVFCYSGVAMPDEVTDRIRGHADIWREVRRLDDTQFVEQVRADAIDILVDLSVHVGYHRLRAFARKPAPVQVTYLGYPGTTGVEAVDYKLSDPHLEPEGSAAESYNVERVLRLPETYFCYRPHDQSPPVSPLPAAANGYVTFAAVNTLLKVTPAVYETWARILAALPTSRLIMQATGLGDPATQAVVLENFARHGIGRERLEFAGFGPFTKFLELFHRVDIALDAFPYSSGTTTCHTLYMGVPVITLAGETAVQRMSLSVLANVGLGELAATTPQEYFDITVSLANDLDRLAAIRSTLRERMHASPLLDARGHARNLERLYRQIWRRWAVGGEA